LIARTFAARLWLALFLFVCLLASGGVLASAFVYFQLAWNPAPADPAPDRPVAVRNGPYVRYFHQHHFDRWKALERTGWRCFGASAAACVFASLLLAAGPAPVRLPVGAQSGAPLHGAPTDRPDGSAGRVGATG
jgi:hypothetical protein